MEWEMIYIVVFVVGYVVIGLMSIGLEGETPNDVSQQAALKKDSDTPSYKEAA